MPLESDPILVCLWYIVWSLSCLLCPWIDIEVDRMTSWPVSSEFDPWVVVTFILSPGLGFRPRPPEAKIESTLIWFSSGVNGNYQPYVDNLESFLKGASLLDTILIQWYKFDTMAQIWYNDTFDTILVHNLLSVQRLIDGFWLTEYTQDSGPSGKGDAVATADDCRAGRPPASGKYCPFNYKDQGLGKDACNANNKFGYELGNPCILIKINKVGFVDSLNRLWFILF